MAAVTRRWLTLVLVAYVAIDLANPLMPGARSFGLDDSVEARRADRSRGHDDVALIRLTPAATAHVRPAPEPAPVDRPVRVSGSGPRRQVARSDPSRSGPPPSLED
jgi:hypothetical protein